MVSAACYGSALYLLSTGEARCEGKTIAKDLIGISSSKNYLAGLKLDGTIILVNIGYKCDKLDVSGWKDIVAVSAGLDHIVGLKSDGTVVTAGKNNSGQCNVSKWKDIMLPSTASTFEEDRREKISLIASELKSKDSRDAFNLAIMRASIRNSRKPICVNYMNLAVLKSDGTVAVTGSNGSGQCRTADFYDIVAVSTNIDYTTGLRADGTLTFTKYRSPWMSYDGRRRIESIQAEALKWRDVVAIDNGGNASAPIAINAFGKVLVTYNERCRLESALKWKDIVAISRCGDGLVGLNASGKVLMTGVGAGYDAEKQYNTSNTYVTWETCTLRKWLNNDFINAAFSSYEKAMIPTVTVSADKNPYYSTNPGNATQDQVFLLSITEANKYFYSNGAMRCKPTDYAVANGARQSGNGNCWWWLRSPGYTHYYAANVYGVVYENGYVVYNDNSAVRPAMWIDLNS